MSEEIRSRAQAYDALDSFDPGATKRAVRFLVDTRDPEALTRILPLTQHPEAAIRFVAKRAVAELRTQAAKPMPAGAAPVEPEAGSAALPMAANGTAFPSANLDPRVSRLLAVPPRRREPRPRSGGVPLRWFDMEL